MTLDEQSEERLFAIANGEQLKTRINDEFYSQMHDPFPERKIRPATYRYLGNPPLGLKNMVRIGATFQDFEALPVVQSLWSDPEKEHCVIKASLQSPQQLSGSHSPQKRFLRVDFIRAGYGCDVTIKPKNNEALHVDKGYKYIALELRREKCDHELSLAFHFRFIDGRGCHWVWGKSLQLSDEHGDSVSPSLTFL